MRPSAAFAPETAATPSTSFAAAVREGLSGSPKTVPARWLYDAIGSTLFEAICLLPWYAITRAETAMLERRASEIARALPAVADVIELGPGNGDKLARLLVPFAARAMPVTVQLVDVSREALDAAERTLTRVPRLRVIAHAADFEIGLSQATSAPRRGGRLVAFLGSNIGNFDPAPAHALIASIAGALQPGDALLLGADLVKPERVLLDAYDDPLGVTAAFNRNLLARMNRELGADFALAQFGHEARWNRVASRVEMHLTSLVAQQVHVPAASLVVSLAAGESIWTESSYKYEPEGVVEMGASAGLQTATQWIDEEARFSLTLFVR